MRTADSVRMGVAVSALVLTATGCGGHTVEKADIQQPATTSGVRNHSHIFNPCSQVSNQVIIDVGLDPTTKNVSPTDKQDDSAAWRVCKWNSVDRQFTVTIFATIHTMDDAKKEKGLVNKIETKIGGRAAQVAQREGEPDSCYTSFEARGGRFEIRATWNHPGDHHRSVCAVSTEYAEMLRPRLPEWASV